MFSQRMSFQLQQAEFGCETPEIKQKWNSASPKETQDNLGSQSLDLLNSFYVNVMGWCQLDIKMQKYVEPSGKITYAKCDVVWIWGETYGMERGIG